MMIENTLFIFVFALLFAGFWFYTKHKMPSCAHLRPLARFVVVCAFMGAVYVGGNKNPLNAPNFGGWWNLIMGGMNTQSVTLPSWWLWDTTDTDEDYVPDLFEKWAGTNPLVADSHLDLAGDNMSSFAKFWNQLDPRLASTMGDGIPDTLKILHGRDPLVREKFLVDEPDENNDGVIDIWEGSGYRYGFIDTTGNGFDDRYELVMPPPGAGNVDIEVSVETSRSAVLLWGVESLVLPKGSYNIRIRVPFDEDTVVSLKPAPDDVVVEGPWKAKMSWRWHPARHMGNETVRMFENSAEPNTFLEGPSEPVQLVTLLGGPPSAGQGFHLLANQNNTQRLDLSYFRSSIKILNLSQIVCIRPGHTGDGIFYATYEGAVVTPLGWFVEGGLWVDGKPDATDTTVFNAMNKGLGIGFYKVWCGEYTWYPDGPIFTPLGTRYAYDKAELRVYECELPKTNILGAASRPDHKPATIHHNAQTHSCNSTVSTYYLGFKHDLPVAMSNLFLLAYHADKDSAYKNTQHTIPEVIWSQGGSINLLSLLDNNYLELPKSERDKLYFSGVERSWDLSNAIKPKSNDSDPFEVQNHILQFPKNPPLKPWLPKIYHIELRHRDKPNEVFDRLWVVVNSPEAQTRFNDWLAQNADLNWTVGLPKVYSQIPMNGLDGVHPDPSSTVWQKPYRKTSLLHHTAGDIKLGIVRCEMLTWHLPNGNGNQAWYDENGILIETPFFAGRPKKFGRENTEDRHFGDYNDEEIYPFLYAAQLDGNPVLGAFHQENAPIWQVSYGNFGTLNAVGEKSVIFWNLTRPCIRIGDNLNQYLAKRPAHPTGKLP